MHGPGFFSPPARLSLCPALPCLLGRSLATGYDKCKEQRQALEAHLSRKDSLPRQGASLGQALAEQEWRRQQQQQQRQQEGRGD